LRSGYFGDGVSHFPQADLNHDPIYASQVA
jgi:hypothetical protein